MVSAKKVIIASKIGDIPLPSEKLPNERNAKITTPIDDKNHTTTATSIIIAIPTRSTFGGPRSSSLAITISPRVLLFSDIIYKKYKTSTNRNKYIRKIQNSKVFYENKINNISMKNPLISMRECSSKNATISYIK